MSKSIFSKAFKLNIHAPGTGFALIILALTQIPVAIKTTAELACIAEVSNQTWRKKKSHKFVNVIAVQGCNGANITRSDF